MTHNVLVYGTLRPGTARKVEVPGTMFDLGAFPGIKLDGSGTVVCELVTVDDSTLSRLDSYEGYYEEAPQHSLYLRKSVVIDGVPAWIYEYNHEIGYEKAVEDGDWLDHIGATHGSAFSFLGDYT